MSQTKKRGRAKRVVLAVLLALCLAGAVVLGLLAWFQWLPLMQSGEVYAQMQQAYFPAQATGPDWQALQARYPGVVGWLRAPDLNIDYPVMQGSNNSYYLYRLPDGSYNVVGSVFLDAENDPLLRDPLSAVYGHHVGGGEMFSPLVNYRSAEFLAQHPTMAYYTPEGAYTVTIFAAHQAGGNERDWLWEYNQAQTEQEAADWLEQLAARSDIAGPQPHPGDRLLALVTCSSLGQGAPRYVVYGILEEMQQ